MQDFIDEAVTEIIDINSHMAVEDKLAKLVVCSKKIFEALKESRSGMIISNEHVCLWSTIITKFAYFSEFVTKSN